VNDSKPMSPGALIPRIALRFSSVVVTVGPPAVCTNPGNFFDPAAQTHPGLMVWSQ